MAAPVSCMRSWAVSPRRWYVSPPARCWSRSQLLERPSGDGLCISRWYVMGCYGVQPSIMGSWYGGSCALCWRTIGCIGCTADGFIYRFSSLTPCTMPGWRCSRSAFSYLTSSRILLCILSGKLTPQALLDHRYAGEHQSQSSGQRPARRPSRVRVRLPASGQLPITTSTGHGDLAPVDHLLYAG